MQITKYPLEFYADMILEKTPFSFSRYGDGEFTCMFSPGTGKNCDKHKYFDGLSRDLLMAFNECVKSNLYFIGIQRLAMSIMGQKIEALVGNSNIAFHDSDVFHRANHETYGLAPLIDALKSVDLIMVGPAHLAPVAKNLGAIQFVEVPLMNCYLEIDSIQERISKAIPKHKYVCVAFSSGMPTNVMIHRLHNSEISLLDLGSIWDPYMGILSRRYHHNRSFIM